MEVKIYVKALHSHSVIFNYINNVKSENAAMVSRIELVIVYMLPAVIDNLNNYQVF